MYIFNQNVLFTQILETAINEINLDDAHNFVDVDSIYVGPEASITIAKLPKPEKDQFRETCRSYYIEMCRQVLNRIDLNDPVLKALEAIDPKKLGVSIATLWELYPNMAVGSTLRGLDLEWRSVVHQELVSTDLEINAFWAEIFKLKNAPNDCVYPQLRQFVGALLSFPHSSASAERIFSRLALIKTKLRNRLEVPTVNAIMAAAGMVDEDNIHLWSPTNELIRSYQKYFFLIIYIIICDTMLHFFLYIFFVIVFK